MLLLRELVNAEKFTSDWMGADGSLADGFYVQARGGKNFSANEGAQHKISRYVPDGAGGMTTGWYFYLNFTASRVPFTP